MKRLSVRRREGHAIPTPAHRRVRRRRGRADSNAQAVVEMALVIPIMLAMVCTFIGLMLEVEAESNIQTATQLAAESAFQAQNAEFNPATAPQARQFTWETFNGTMQFPSYIQPISAACESGSYDYNCSGTVPGFWCTGQYVHPGSGEPHGTVTCDARTTLNFNSTPLAWILGFYQPVIGSTGTVQVPPERQ